jgi:hypothetical protein
MRKNGVRVGTIMVHPVDHSEMPVSSDRQAANC